MCEITALDRDLSHPRRMIARQTARCACRRGQVAGTTRAKPACVDGKRAPGLPRLPALTAPESWEPGSPDSSKTPRPRVTFVHHSQ